LREKTSLHDENEEGVSTLEAPQVYEVLGGREPGQRLEMMCRSIRVLDR